MQMKVKSFFQVIGRVSTKTTTSLENNKNFRERRGRNRAELEPECKEL